MLKHLRSLVSFRFSLKKTILISSLTSIIVCFIVMHKPEEYSGNILHLHGQNIDYPPPNLNIYKIENRPEIENQPEIEIQPELENQEEKHISRGKVDTVGEYNTLDIGDQTVRNFLPDELRPEHGHTTETASEYIKPGYIGQSGGDKVPSGGLQKVSVVKRPGLIIMGYSRSGTSYVDKVFNNDPELFNVYEPLQIPNGWRQNGETFLLDYDSAVKDIIMSHMSCNFSTNFYTKKYLQDLAAYWRYRRQSNGLSSPPFCYSSTDKMSCIDLESDRVSQVCRDNYKGSVIKICYERIPPRPVCKLGYVLQIVEEMQMKFPDVDVKIVNLIRDPRGLVNSRINFGWVADYPSDGLVKNSHYLCLVLKKIILHGRNLTGYLSTKYRELQYDEFFRDPVTATKELYKFAGFHEVPEVVKEYIISTTQPEESVWKETEKRVLNLIRNSTRNLDRWKREGSVERNAIIEKSCKDVLQLLNLKPWDPNDRK